MNALRARLLNAVRRSARWVPESNLLDFLEVIDPLWLLDKPNIGWGSLEELQRYLAENDRVNHGLIYYLTARARRDQFKTQHKGWV